MRYRLVPPVEGGFAYWNIADTQSEVMPNFAVASFSIHLPNAETEARYLTERLNGAV